MRKDVTLGIWDGHDAGAAIIAGDSIVFAINEERLSRRKLEIGFPQRSVSEALSFCDIQASEITHVAYSTFDFAKTLTRFFPHLKEEYYLLRRKKKYPGKLNGLKKLAKYAITQLPPTSLSKTASSRIIRKELQKIGIIPDVLEAVDHHTAHAATAAFCSGFDDCPVITLDGIGDGKSGGVWEYSGKTLKKRADFRGSDSLGIFFEHVTNLLNMRELEDEGKVMALANFAFPIPDSENPLIPFFSVDGLRLRARHSSLSMYRELKHILWRYPSEQFAHLAQRALEVHVCTLIKNAMATLRKSRVAYAGGVASNVKANMLIRALPELEELFIFPHMGDGGLALGAALWSNYKHTGQTTYQLEDLYLGPDYSDAAIKDSAKNFPEICISDSSDILSEATRLLCDGEIIFWFNGRAELGPRALGARSILARPDSLDIKDKLNIKLKKRVWYQPFCPTMLEDDAKRLLRDYHGSNQSFMTEAFVVREEHRKDLLAVINVDGSCRPQILREDSNTRFAQLLREIRNKTGLGVVLNTSFNIHGDPPVLTPQDALETFRQTDVTYAVFNSMLATKGPARKSDV